MVRAGTITPGRSPTGPTTTTSSIPRMRSDTWWTTGFPFHPGPPGRAALARLAVLRDLVRREAADRAPGAAPARRPTDEEVAAVLEDVAFRLGTNGPRPVRTGWTGFVDGLLPALLELRHADARLRVCANPRCRFAFVDRSRNRSRIWCETAVCGNRIRVGRHRRRAVHRSA